MTFKVSTEAFLNVAHHEFHKGDISRLADLKTSATEQLDENSMKNGELHAVMVVIDNYMGVLNENNRRRERETGKRTWQR